MAHQHLSVGCGRKALPPWDASAPGGRWLSWHFTSDSANARGFGASRGASCKGPPCAGSPVQDVELTKGLRAAAALEDKRFMARHSHQELVSGPPVLEME